LGSQQYAERRERLLRFRRANENSYCADCSEENPEYVAVTYGVFLCKSCANSHVKISDGKVKVYSIVEDKWEAEEMLWMEHRGNAKVNGELEASLPTGFHIKSLFFCFFFF
jgi:hypothetical protein